ncbi:LpxD N-terminal domain-containing protein [Halobacterium yunchengense]|uniref:LpxD N-terminal domain-containing protein n=1 Tax=Halobacterium yunchengense TaxID=3108497 RepID=UPI003008C3BD
MTVAASTVASFLDAAHTGPDAVVSDVDALDEADGDDMAFCVYENPEYVRASSAGVVVCPESLPELEDRALVRSPDPKLDFARAAEEFFDDGRTETGVHPTASVADGATVGADCYVGPNAVVGESVRLGDRVRVQAGAVVGTPGFGYVREDDDSLLRQYHGGEVVLEDDVTVGPNASIDRAVFGETRVRRGAKLSGNVHLAHQTEIGEDVTVACGCGFAGGATVGARATVHPQVSVATDVEVGADAELGMHATVLDDVPEGALVVGSPAEPVGGES